MTALDSYHDLTEQGFNFWLEQGVLKCHAPKGKMTADILAWLKSHKSELIDLLATNDHFEKIAVENYSHTADEHPHIEEVTPTWRMDRYTQSELHDLLGKDEKELFHHLLECRQCDFEVARYCPEIFTTGRRYDDLLLSFNNAASKREALLNTVIRARISGRKVFVGLDYANIGELPQTPVKPLVYGIADSERPFVNHLGTCTQCKPASRIYCAHGLQLKANA